MKVLKIKKGKVFIWYSGRWMNINLETAAHGGGIKGFSRWLWHFLRCVFGIHRKGSFFGPTYDKDRNITGYASWRACMYCHKHKEIIEDRDN